MRRLWRAFRPKRPWPETMQCYVHRLEPYLVLLRSVQFAQGCAFLEKPFPPDELADKVRDLLVRKAAA
jgi:hypothetical protein